MNKEIRRADVVIVGGGASGLAAAIELGMKAPALDVLIIEKMPEPGRKIRATGSGYPAFLSAVRIRSFASLTSLPT